MEEEVISNTGFRVRAVQRMLEGADVTRLSRDLKVSRWALYRWKKIYLQEGTRGLALLGGKRPLGESKGAREGPDESARAQARVQELERKVGQQAVQIDFLSRAFKRAKESRQSSGGNGGTASTGRSGQ